ncbi:MAG: fatty acid desaturase [Pseudomonadota bacterium]
MPPIQLAASPAPDVESPEDTIRSLTRHCLGYRDAIDSRAWTQLALTLALYLTLCGVMLFAISSGYWAAVVLCLPAGMLLVRLFTFQHDCGHGSFFSNRRWNDAVGRVLSVCTFTPYGFWKRTHALHHSSAGDLGRRGIGDVDTYTVREYEALTPRERLLYRIYRHPLILHVVGPPVYFTLLMRSPWGQPLSPSESWRSIMALNVALLVVYGGLALAFGLGTVALALLPVACITSWVGGWLFFVQHQFEHTHWEQSDKWHLQTAALHGSSYYVLPAWLNWLTGDIALHHIHHLNSRVPGYRLRECMQGEPRLAQISRLTIRESIGCIGLSLWHEDKGRLMSFKTAAQS